MVRFGVGFGGFGNPYFRFRWFERGHIKYVILDLLSEKPRHGYEIMKELEARSSGFYTPSAGSVYPTLQLLEDLELVKSQEANGRKVYEITEKGKQELKEQKEKVGNPWDRSQRWQQFKMEDLNDLFEDLGDLKKFVRMRMQAHGMTPEKMKRIKKIISEAKEEILEVLKN